MELAGVVKEREENEEKKGKRSYTEYCFFVCVCGQPTYTAVSMFYLCVVTSELFPILASTHRLKIRSPTNEVILEIY